MPPPKFRILVTDDIDAEGVGLLSADDRLVVDEVPTLPREEVLARIGEYDALIGRSATKISTELLERGTRLRVIGRAGVGVDNIAMDSATELGIAVINAPAGNTIAVAELVFGTLIGLLRNIPRATESMRAGRWDRADFLGSELKGRTLGIVGVGRIGSEVAVRAHAFGMSVVGYDPYIPEERFRALRVRSAPSLDALLDDSDIVTVHTPLTAETKGMIGAAELARLKPGGVVANIARGGIIDETALLEALDRGHLAGAVLDVYAAEPLAKDHPLRAAANVVLTPHIGASTAEAQRNVAVDVCRGVRDALVTGELSRSINVEWPGEGHWAELRPTIGLTDRAATLARALLADRGVRAVRRLSIRVGPELIGAGQLLLSAAAVGCLRGVLETDRLNLINARSLAEARGIELGVAEHADARHPTLIEVSIGGAAHEVVVAGVATSGAPPRITRIGQFHVDVAPRQTLIVLGNNDVPGVIGRVGTMLGNAGVNIAEYHQARLGGAQGGEALAAISVDGETPADLRHRLLELPDVLSASVVRFV